jgi:hypothetical protein
MRTSESDGAQMRATPRVKIFQAGEMRRGAGAPTRVHLLNISTGGALVYADSVPPVGEQVVLACGVPLGSARVQWSSGRRFGVAFTQPIGRAQIEAVIRTQEARVEATTQRLGAIAVR